MPISAVSARARLALINELEVFDERSAARGLAYYRKGAINESSVETDETGVSAEVRGTHVYDVELNWDGTEWDLTCSCPVGYRCKHTYAVARYWLDHAQTRASQTAGAVQGIAKSLKTATPDRTSPADELIAQFESAHGRKLTKSETKQVHSLARLFEECRRSRFTPSTYEFQKFGFHPSAENIQGYHRAFENWWRIAGPPKSPLELWQHLALDAKRNGKPTPPLYAPLTDTAALEAQLEEEFVRREIDVWQKSQVLVPPRQALGQCVDLRLTFALDGAFLEYLPTPDAKWKRVTRNFAQHLREARPSLYLGQIPEAAHALLLTLLPSLQTYYFDLARDTPLPPEMVSEIIRNPATHAAVFLPGGAPWVEPTEALEWRAIPSEKVPGTYEFALYTTEGKHVPAYHLLNAHPRPIFWVEDRVYWGEMPPPSPRVSARALQNPTMVSLLQRHGIEPPPEIAAMIEQVKLRPRLRCWLKDDSWSGGQVFCAALEATGGEPVNTARWSMAPRGWRWEEGGPGTHKRPDRIFQFDFSNTDDAQLAFERLGLHWSTSIDTFHAAMSPHLLDRFLNWRAEAPANLEILVTKELEGLLTDPYRVRLTFDTVPSDEESGQDWFDLEVKLTVDDTTLTEEERALLLAAQGRWVRLPRLGWRRLEMETDTESAEALERLGFDPQLTLKDGATQSHRLHALQLAGEADMIARRDTALAETLRERLRSIQAEPPRTLPSDLRATLRPYQSEGFQFLTHLSGLRLGGILADDMGLGKTVQTLAWLLHLRHETASKKSPFHALVVCPKSVAHGWEQETRRFAAKLRPVLFTPKMIEAKSALQADSLLIVNYTQLRLARDWFKKQQWHAAVLDEGQFIKNPNSQVSRTAFALRATHRLVLTGTPVENRLSDLWSLLQFAQPGLLGPKTSFRRHYPDKDESAHPRLRRRIRHFMLRRTKAQVATDLPPRTEDELQVELEGRQRTLYDAELKQARKMLLKIDSDREFDQARFNILASLLRLRQICCHPGLVDPAHDALPSAKLEALLERVTELHEEGQKVLIFSQFVSMLDRVSAELDKTEIPHLTLTGKTQNRADLVSTFQQSEGPPVFLLSLKAAGFGLNLTAASYVFLLDPWWNPAVEAQAIDRTHRIGQVNPVVAYRLIAKDTVEEKIRALQREKSALAERVVQEENLAQVLDIESLRQILA
jgi:superfamily II DNA or RNA helicase